MGYQNLLLEQKEPGIYLLILNRPKSLNALNLAVLGELAQAVEEVSQDARARAMLVTGAGDRAFVAGADIVEMQNFSPMEAKAFSEKGLRVFRSLENLPIPVIALVNGYCLGGGCELAMSCDWLLASDKAVFGQPEVNLGITAGFGGTQRLQRLVGRARAMEILVTGRQVKAEEALAIGLVNSVCPAGELWDKGLETARLIASKGPVAVRLTKQTLQRGQDMDLFNACILESDAFGLSFSTEDRKEGIQAFVEKRAARFEGR